MIHSTVPVMAIVASGAITITAAERTTDDHDSGTQGAPPRPRPGRGPTRWPPACGRCRPSSESSSERGALTPVTAPSPTGCVASARAGIPSSTNSGPVGKSRSRARCTTRRDTTGRRARSATSSNRSQRALAPSPRPTPGRERRPVGRDASDADRAVGLSVRVRAQQAIVPSSSIQWCSVPSSVSRPSSSGYGARLFHHEHVGAEPQQVVQRERAELVEPAADHGGHARHRNGSCQAPAVTPSVTLVGPCRPRSLIASRSGSAGSSPPPRSCSPRWRG